MATNHQQQLLNWYNGTPTGGPNGDGRYPLTDSAGVVHLVLCPKAEQAFDLAGQNAFLLLIEKAEAAAAAAEAAITAVQGNATAAANSAAAAATAKTAAETAKTAAETARTQAQTARTDAQTARTDAQTARTDAQSARDAAAASATAAANSAAAAALFDPSSYFTKTQSDERYPIVVSGTRTKQTVLNGAGEFASRIFNNWSLATDTGGNRFLQIGKADALQTTDGAMYVDFFASNTTDVTNWSARLIRAAGANGGLTLANTGTGNLNFQVGGITAWVFQGSTNQISVSSSWFFNDIALRVNSAVGSHARVGFNTGGQLRWTVGGNSEAENGTNSGTNFEVRRYSDAGTYAGISLQINRATGQALFEARPTFAGNLAWDAGNFNPATKVDVGEAWTRGISSAGNRVSSYSASGDLDLARGFHAIYANGPANRPVAGNGVVWGLSSTVSGLDYGVQEWGRANRRFFRTLEGDVWGLWHEYVHSGVFNVTASGLSNSNSRRITDFNALGTDGSTSGFISAASSATGTPIGGSTVGLNLSFSSTGAVQMMSTVSATAPRMFLRSTASGTAWSPWFEAWTTANLDPSGLVNTSGQQDIAGLKTFTWGAIKTQGYSGNADSGVLYLGNLDRWMYKPSGHNAFWFKVNDAGNAVLDSNGTILTTEKALWVFGTQANMTSHMVLRAYTDNANGEASIQYFRGAVSHQGGWDFRVANGTANGTLAVRLEVSGVVNAQRGVTVWNAGQLKVFDNNGTQGVELGQGYTNGSDFNGYLWNRANGFLSLGTNNTERARIMATGQSVWRWDMRHYVGNPNAQSVIRYLGWNNEVPRWAEVVEADATYSLYSYNNVGGASDRMFNFIGTSMGTKRAVFSAEVASMHGNNFWRSIVGNYGVFWHQNSSEYYLMITNSADQWGSWSTKRPMYFNVDSGNATFGHHVTVNGDLYMGGGVQSAGSNLLIGGNNSIILRPNGIGNATGQVYVDAAGVLRANNAIYSYGGGSTIYWQNRQGSEMWAWYCADNVTRLWNGSADVMNIDGNGRVQIKGGPWLTQESGELRIEGTWRSYHRPNILAANSAAWVRQPRIFVQSADPGAQAEDGDIWMW